MHVFHTKISVFESILTISKNNVIYVYNIASDQQFSTVVSISYAETKLISVSEIIESSQ